MKEEKKKRISLLFLSIFLAIMLVLSFLAPPLSRFGVSAEAEIATQADVSTDDVTTRFKTYNKEDITQNIPQTQYYDTTLTNDSNSNVLSDEWFSWSAGANVMNNNINQIVFTLNLENSLFSDDDLYLRKYMFATLKKASKDTNTSEDVLSLCFYITSSMVAVYIKQSKLSSETIGLYTQNEFAGSDLIGSNVSDSLLSGYVLVAGYVRDSTTYVPFYGDVEKQLHFVVETSFLTDSYFMTLDYSFVSKTASTSVSGAIDSKIVGVYDILKQMDEKHELEYLSEEMQEEAQRVLTDETIKKIQVSWLEQIGDTPFATKQYDWVEVSVVSNKISPADVAVALDKDSFAVGQSSCQYFQEDTDTGIFNAYYLKNVWLSSKDANGHSMNLFLDINVSYKDYYKKFVDDGIFTRGMYEWFWSTMIVDYPEISGIDDENLYGYFGYTSVPYTYTLNQLVYEMFDGSPNMDGVVRYFSYRDNLSYSSYMKLLDDYDYGWLSKAWNTVAGFVAGQEYPADHYFFYVDGEQDNAFIGNNGADDAYDNGSALANGVKDVVEDIAEGLSIIFDNPLTKYLALIILLFFVTWFILFFFRGIFKVKKAKQEYKNAKRKRK